MSRAYASKLSGDERVSAIAELLAAGLARLLHRQSSGLLPPPRDSSLDLPHDQSGGAEPECMAEVGK